MCRFILALLLAISLTVVIGCIAHSSTMSAYTQLTSSTTSAPQPAYISALPMVNAPITKAKFEQVKARKGLTKKDLDALFGSPGTDVSSQVHVAKDEQVYAWRNSATSYVQITISKGGTRVEGTATNLDEGHPQANEGEA